MLSLRNKKKISMNYPQYPLLSGALAYSDSCHNVILPVICKHGVLFGEIIRVNPGYLKVDIHLK